MIYSFTRLTIGSIEIASGTVNALIKLSGTESEFALTLREYLFYLELLSLGGIATDAIKSRLRASAKKALAQEKEIARLREVAENVDEAEGLEDVIENLNKTAKRACLEFGLK